MDTEEFIQKANAVHNCKYDYKQTEFIRPKVKVKIICPIHGLFEQRANNHLLGRGCRKCGRDVTALKFCKKWKPEEIEFLKQNYSNTPMKDMVLKLKTNNQTIRKKARELNLKTNFRLKIHPSIPNGLWANLKRGAKDRGLELSITVNDIWDLFLKQKRKCALTGWDIDFSRIRGKTTASVDRIDSNKGYSKDNIQIVHKRINITKQDSSDPDFFIICKAVYENRKDLARNHLEWIDDIWFDTIYPKRTIKTYL